MATGLTNGGIHTIFNEFNAESTVFQVLKIENVQGRHFYPYRMKLSDGRHYSESTFILHNFNLTPYSIIRVKNYRHRPINSGIGKIMVISDIDVLHIGRESDDIIGNPTPYETSFLQGASSNTQQTPMEISSSQLDQPSTSTVNRGSLNASQNSSFAGEASSVTAGICSISSLTDDDPPREALRVRAVNKSDILEYENDYEEGTYFYVDLIDESGEIRGKAFKEHCDTFYDEIEVGNVYYIKRAQVETANMTFMPLKNEYQIIFNKRTRVALCQEETNIPHMIQFQFVKIEEIDNFEFGTFIDVIGVCTEIGDTSRGSKSNGKDYIRRVIEIADGTDEVRVALWGSHAEDFDGPLNSVIAFKGACVSDYDGRSLSVPEYSIMMINPDIQEAHKLRAWYDE